MGTVILRTRRNNWLGNDYLLETALMIIGTPVSDIEVFQGANAPPYLPYIALWVLAKSEEEEPGFYAKVAELIGEPFPNNTRQQMAAVWTDLEYWSTAQQEGRFGRFKLNVLGEHR